MSGAPVTREEFETLLRELAEVKARLARLEPSFEPSEETILMIAAAVSAYLGKRASIRIVRRIPDTHQWRMQGRAALQGSHSMPRTRALPHSL